MFGQRPMQAVVVPGVQRDANQESIKLALFDESGEPVDLGGGEGFSNVYMGVQQWDNTNNEPMSMNVARQVRMPHDFDVPFESTFFGVIRIDDGLVQKLAFQAQSVWAIGNFSFDVYVHNLMTGNGVHFGVSIVTRGGPDETAVITSQESLSFYDVWGPDGQAAWDEYTPADPSEAHLLNVESGPLLVGGAFGVAYSSSNPE